MQQAKRIFVLSLGLLLVLAFSACRNNEGDTPEGDAKAGGEITVGIAADLDSSLDPHKSSGAAGTREVLFNVFEGLVKPDTDGNLVPAVASSYVINDEGETCWTSGMQPNPFLENAYNENGERVARIIADALGRG